MPIIVNLDVMLAKRKMRSKELAERIGITEQNVSLLKSGKVKGIRFDTLEKICEVLQCQPGDILVFEAESAGILPWLIKQILSVLLAVKTLFLHWVCLDQLLASVFTLNAPLVIRSGRLVQSGKVVMLA